MKNRALPLSFSRMQLGDLSDGAALRDGPANHVNPFEWDQSVGVARQVCARIFRDGGTPEEALRIFGLSSTAGTDWSRAVDRIAEAMTAPGSRRRAA